MIRMLPLISQLAINEGPERNWTQYGQGDWSIEASEVKAGGGSRSVLLPGIGKPISFLKWKVKKDREGEVQGWIASASRYRYTIWND